MVVQDPDCNEKKSNDNGIVFFFSVVPQSFIWIIKSASVLKIGL